MGESREEREKRAEQVRHACLVARVNGVELHELTGLHTAACQRFLRGDSIPRGDGVSRIERALDERGLLPPTGARRKLQVLKEKAAPKPVQAYYEKQPDRLEELGRDGIWLLTRLPETRNGKRAERIHHVVCETEKVLAQFSKLIVDALRRGRLPQLRTWLSGANRFMEGLIQGNAEQEEEGA